MAVQTLGNAPRGQIAATIVTSLRRGLTFLVGITLAACITLFPTAPQPGETEAQVIARLGQPTSRYQDGPDRLLEYAKGPFGQQTYMARIGPDGKLASYEQVLTLEKFATIEPGTASKQDVLRTIGRPSETSFLAPSQLEVWSYPYREGGVWNSLMHVHFDRSGVVRKMESGPDPNYDPDRRFPFLMISR